MHMPHAASFFAKRVNERDSHQQWVACLRALHLVDTSGTAIAYVLYALIGTLSRNASSSSVKITTEAVRVEGAN